MKPLKGYSICFLAGTLGVGGAEKQLFYILRALNQLGADVHLICNYSGEYWEKPIQDLGIKYYSLQGKGNPISKLLKIIRYVRRVRPHIIQSQHFYMSLYAALAAKFCGAISVGATRSSLLAEMNAGNARFRKLCFTLPDHFMMNSLQAMEEAKELDKDHGRLHYLPNAIETEKFFSITGKGNLIKGKPVKFLTIGRAAPQKRFERFIDLIAGLNEAGYNVAGTLVGYGPLLEDLKALAQKRGIADIMFFPGKTSTPEKYLADADIFVLTSDHEGTPNVILEAMASALPILTTNVGNVPYFLKEGENGFIVEKGSGEELFKKAKILANDHNLRLKIGNNNRQVIKNNFSISSLEKNLTHFYIKVKPCLIK